MNSTSDHGPVHQALQAFQAARSGGQPEQALAEANRAASLARAGDEPALLQRSLNAQAQAERDLGHLDRARCRYEELVSLCARSKTPLGEAHALRHVADLHLEAGQLGPAAASYARVLGLYHGTRDAGTLDLANALRGYALLREQLGEPREACTLWREARERYAEAGVAAGVAECDEHLPGDAK